MSDTSKFLHYPTEELACPDLFRSMPVMDTRDDYPIEAGYQPSGSGRGPKRAWPEKTDEEHPSAEKRHCAVAPTDRSFPSSQWDHGDSGLDGFVPMALDEDAVPNLDVSVPGYDTCFGVVTAPVMSSFYSKQEGSQVPVNITPSGDKLKLHTRDDNKYAGIISITELSTAIRQLSVKLKAKLFTSDDKATQLPGFDRNKKLNVHFPRECLLRIVVSGLRSESDGLGNLLSEAGLYLPHPCLNDLDTGMDYFNPHYLLRPGASMPSLTELSVSVTELEMNTATSSLLDETGKSRFMQLFDAANDDRSKLLVEPSRRLKTTLKE